MNAYEGVRRCQVKKVQKILDKAVPAGLPFGLDFELEYNNPYDVQLRTTIVGAENYLQQSVVVSEIDFFRATGNPGWWLSFAWDCVNRMLRGEVKRGINESFTISCL